MKTDLHNAGCINAIHVLRAHGAGRFATRRPQGKFRPVCNSRAVVTVGVTGEADVQALMPDGRSVAVEVKAKTDSSRPAQREWRDEWVAQGGLYYLLRYKGPEHVEDANTELRAWLAEQGYSEGAQ